MDYQRAVEYLDAHVGAGMQPGLERIQLLVDSMGSPHQGYSVIHVAGTNGKSSTTRMTALLCVAHGLNTGTYTSPHLQAVEERLGIHGRVATPEELAQAVTDVAAFADLLEQRAGVRFSYFELTTAMAFAFFAEKAIDTAVIEVGLGGRLDATNVVEADVAVVTGIGLEHTEYLGTTLEAIGAEKLAIAKPGSILVTGPLPEAVASVAEGTARSLGIEHRVFDRDFSVVATKAVGGWVCDIHGAEAEYEGVYLPVHGRHQTTNAALAVAATEAALGRALDESAVLEATASFTTPGRMETVAVEPVVLLDGAHNPDGFAKLADSLAEEFPSIRWVLVVGVMEDKDLASMVPQLADRIESVIATAIDDERALPAEQLAARLRAILAVDIEAIGDPAAAVEVARGRAGGDGGVLVTGSLYMVGQVRAALVGPG